MATNRSKLISDKWNRDARVGIQKMAWISLRYRQYSVRDNPFMTKICAAMTLGCEAAPTNRSVPAQTGQQNVIVASQSGSCLYRHYHQHIHQDPHRKANDVQHYCCHNETSLFSGWLLLPNQLVLRNENAVSSLYAGVHIFRHLGFILACTVTFPAFVTSEGV